MSFDSSLDETLKLRSSKGQIFGAMQHVMAAVEPVAKSRKNVQQDYQFRGIDDIYAALQAIMAKHGVFTIPTVLNDRTEDRTSKAGSLLIYRVLTIRYTFYCAADGSSIDSVVIGEGMDSGDKASNKAMAVAHKYALLQAFCIPTKEPKDPENDHHQVDQKQTSILDDRNNGETFLGHPDQVDRLKKYFDATKVPLALQIRARNAVMNKPLSDIPTIVGDVVRAAQPKN